jgi:hypothetical protein
VTAAVMGWKPDPAALETAHGCDEAIALLKGRKTVVNEAMMQRRGSEREPFVEELARLDSLRRDLIERRAVLLRARSDGFDRMLRRVIQDHVGRPQLEAWMAEANERMAQAQAKVVSGRGPALDPRGAGGGVRTRR